MKLFVIDRDITGWTEDDLEAAKMRGEMCILHFPEMRWIRSFVDLDLGHSVCLYEAASEAEIREHAEMSKLPCNEVREVFELVPELMPSRA